MYFWQFFILLFVTAYSLAAFFLGFRNTYSKKNPYGLATLFNPLGAFVWVDAVVFGAFFFFASLISIIAGNFILFCVVYSVFWVIRSVGEQIYWFFEQFAQKHRNPPQTLKMSRFFPGESIWVYYQIFWQCVSVAAIILSVYFFHLLLS